MKLVKWMLVAAIAAGTFHTVSAMDGVATVTGGDVQYQGAADVQWVDGTELLLKFTGEGSFVLPDPATVRILAIGGGGGGGGVCTASSAMTGQHGGGGGGGAGGFVDVSNVLPAATYVVAVGAGGAGGASRSNHSSPYYPGTSGGDTTLSTNGVACIFAHGGGGGGGETDGLSGGGGGGGSQFRQSSTAGVARPGGPGTPGQGSAGGAGDLGLYGGGGGGAGGAGAAASTLNPVGGDGLTSDITGEAVWYAGGGGGGFCDKSFTGLHEPVAGGRGGGGNGGYGRNVPATDATFYGGGGGGCGAPANSATTSGGNGHPGVVYVRIVSLDRPVTTYPLWVGGVQVCETNKNDILGDGTASFAGTASGGTLSLSNATITATHQFEDEWSSGSNTATVFSGEGFDLTISLTGSNILQNADHPLISDQGHGYGVRSQGNLAITGGGALVAWVEYDGAGIDTDGDLLVDGAVVTAHSEQDGFNVDGGLVISNAIVTVRGSNYAGISVGDGDIVIADSVVTVTGYDGIEADGQTVTVSGTSVVMAETTYDEEFEEALVAGALVLRDGLAITEPAGGAFDADAGYVVDPATGKAALRVVIAAPPPPFVTNVVARQRWPWNGLVDVDYEVGGSTTGLVARISFAEQGGEGRAWVATNFLAGAEPSAEPGFHRATWNTKADGATNVVAAKVTATIELVRKPPVSDGNVWSLIGDFNSWAGDVDMTLTDGKWVSPVTKITAGGFKIRFNHDWTETVGGVMEALGTPFAAIVGGDNISIEEENDYVVTYDPEAQSILVEVIGWGVVGTINSWGGSADLAMKEENGMFARKNVTLTADDEIKVRYCNSWDVNYGGRTDVGFAVEAISGSDNLKPGAGTYDIWLDAEKKALFVMKAGEAPKYWGVVGTINGWGGTPDAVMYHDAEGYFVAKGITLAEGDEIKIRKNSDWTDNRGASDAAPDTALDAVSGGDNIKVAAGTYDVYYQSASEKIYVMTAGKTPADAQ